MPKLSIDGRPVEVEAGATILDAAEKLGIEIPTMCYLRGHEATTSCMVCVVKVLGAKGLLPACGTPARDGMQVENDCEEVRDARRSALELLLSDHVGDCVGPCQMACPAHMDIPLMIRQIEAGQLKDAIATVKRDIALPAVLGRICPAPCEKVCRRAQHDEAVSICLLKRFVAGVDLQSDETYRPACAAERGKRVAIIGAGPAGLAASMTTSNPAECCGTVFRGRSCPATSWTPKSRASRTSASSFGSARGSARTCPWTRFGHRCAGTGRCGSPGRPGGGRQDQGGQPDVCDRCPRRLCRRRRGAQAPPDRARRGRRERSRCSDRPVSHWRGDDWSS